jgi:hypothetical protein
MSKKQKLGHPGAKGDALEVVIARKMATLLPNSVQCDKAQVVNSHGSRSAQFDMVVAASSDVLNLFGRAGEEDGHQTLVPVENVRMVLEIKDRLKKEHVAKFLKSLDFVRGMNRYYRATQVGKALNGGLDKYRDQVFTGSQALPPVGVIIGAIIALDGPRLETVRSWLMSAPEPIAGLGPVCILEKGVVLPTDQTNGEIEILGRTERGDAYIAMASAILFLTEMTHEAETWVVPDASRYMSQGKKPLMFDYKTRQFVGLEHLNSGRPRS